MHIKRNKISASITASILLAAASTSAWSAELRTSQKPIQDQYIVVLNPQAASLAGERSSAARVSTVAQTIATDHRVKLVRTYQSALRGFVVRADDAALAKLLADPRVAYVEEDGIAKINALDVPEPIEAVQTGATWGIDRINQRGLPLDGTYSYTRSGAGVHMYVIDSGLRATHTQFAGRVGNGFTAIGDGNGTNDCNGHGTHVAGTVAGTTWGVAKSAIVHPVRVFGCSGGSAWSTIIAGVDWVAANRQLPAVANMSLGGGGNTSLDAAVENLINRGVTVVVAAGNDNGDACAKSPARVRRALTIASTETNDARSSFSNYGSCVDLFAPGGSITSAWPASDTASSVLSGTSMASPHVAGSAALFLEANPSASPADVTFALVGKSTANVVVNPGPASPNLMLYSRLHAAQRGAFFRYLNVGNGDHFYTMNWNELGAGGFAGWAYEGVTGYMRSDNAAGTQPMYRYFNTGNGDHFYTTNFGELGNGGFSGWVYVGVAGYTPTLASRFTGNLYRYVNSGNGDHFYTANFAELGAGGSNGWVYEGVQSQIWIRP